MLCLASVEALEWLVSASGDASADKRDALRTEQLCDTFRRARLTPSALVSFPCAFALLQLNPDVNAFQRSFVGDIRRLDEMDRRIRFFTAQIDAVSSPAIHVPALATIPPFITVGPRGPQAIDELDVKLQEHEGRLGQMNASWEALVRKQRELEEAKCVLRETAVFFQQAEGRSSEIRSSFDEDNAPLLEGHGDQGPSDSGVGGGGYDLEFVSGTIDRLRMPTFERILWRVLRGNLYMNYAEIDQLFVDPVTGAETRKNVFIIFAHGAELLSKIRKVAESMGGTLYPVDSNADKRNDALREVEGRLEDLNTVCWNTTQTRRVELSKIAEGLEAWRDAVQKEKAVFQTMNLLSYDARRKTLVAEGWCPSRDITAIQLALRRATETAGTSIPPILSELRTHQTPPTFHRTTVFTEAFQTIIDAYGIATYQEVNPGLFTVITFPFLFAVMFGDLGHGFLAFAVGTYMCLWEKKLAKAGLGEIFETFFL